MDTAAQKKGNWFSNLNNNYSSWAGGESFLGGGITNGSLVNAGMGALNMGVNMLAGQNQTGIGNALQTIGGLASNIPGVGGLIGAGVGVVGGLVNAAFGSHINDEFVQQTQLGANQIGSQIFNANTNADLLNDWQNTTQMSNVSKSEVGSDGWFSNKASRKTRELNRQINEANQRQLVNFGIAAENVDTQNDLRILQNMAAYGGPINSFRKYYGDGGKFDQPQTFFGRVAQALGASPKNARGADVVSSVLQMTPYGHYVAALDLGRDINRAYHKEKGAWEDIGWDLASMLPFLNKAGLKEGNSLIDTVRGNSKLRSAVNTTAIGGRTGDFVSDTYGANKANIHDKGGYLSQAKALIRQNEGWRDKPYSDSPKGKNWRSVGYGFNDSGFRDKYPEGISKHYEHGITKKQAEEELDYFLNKAEKQLKSIYGKQWNDFSDSQKAAILDTYYQRPASVGKSSRFYKAVTAGEDAGRYLGVAGYNKRNKVRQDIFGGGYSGYGDWSDTESNPNSSSLQEVTPFTPVVHDLDLSGITPTEAKALELNLTSPTFDLSMFGKPMTTPTQQAVPTVGTVEDFLASYGDFEDNLFKEGGNLYGGGGGIFGIMPMMPLTLDNLRKAKDKAVDYVRQKLYERVDPVSYDIPRAISSLLINGRETGKNDIYNALWAKYLNRTNTQAGQNVDEYLQPAVYSLTKGTPIGKLYRLTPKAWDNSDDMNPLGDEALYHLLKSGKKSYVTSGNTKTGLGDYTVSLGEDEKGKYMSYYDEWDISPIGNKRGKAGKDQSMGIGTPFSVYDRRYYTDEEMQHIISEYDKMYKSIEEATKNQSVSHEIYSPKPYKAKKHSDGGNLFEDGDKLNIKDMNIFDFGGGLTHGVTFDTGVDWVNEGGSHGENPYGGVMVGSDEDGIPNLVEESEAIWNGDYVFSRRMKVPKKLREKYHLKDDATFADAIKVLTKDSEERPLDNISRRTQDHILGEFADSQEELRAAKAQRAMEKEQQLQEDFLTGVQFGLGGALFADNSSKWHDDGGFLFDNSFAYGGPFGNVFAGEGNKANRLSPEESARYLQALNAAQQRSIIASLFGDDSPVTRTVEKIGEVVEDPIGYFAGDQIDAIMNRVAQMSQPQMEKFFSTSLGQAVAKGVVEADKYLSSGTDDNMQKAGVNRWYKATGRMAKPVYRATVNAAKRAMAQSKQVARSQMKTPKGGGKPTRVAETTTPVQRITQSIRGGVNQPGWSTNAGPSTSATIGSGQTARPLNARVNGTAGRGAATDPFEGLEGTMSFGRRTPFEAAAERWGGTPTDWKEISLLGGASAIGLPFVANYISDKVHDAMSEESPQINSAVQPASAVSNRGNNTGKKAEITQGAKPEVRQSSGKSGTKTTQKKSVATPNSDGIFSYGYYTNGSDGYSTPTGFKVGDNGRAYDYTNEYRNLVNSLGANDIRKWAAEHPNDPSLKSFLARGNKLENLTDEQWRTGATDGKYGFMHHVANQLSKDISFDPHEDDVRAAMLGDTPSLNEAIRQAIAMDGYTPEYTAEDAAIINGLTPGTTEQSSSFKPKQTWTRYAPLVMSGLMGLKDMLTPADYGNADSIMEAAYQVGSPVSIGTEYLGDYRKRDPFDERYLMNLINQRGAATNRNMMNLSGGNRAAAMAGILSNDLTTQMSLAEAARQSYLANRADDAQVAEFNRGTNQFNATAQNQRNQFLAGLNSQRQQAMLSGISQGARLRQAIKDQRDAAISANLTNLAQGLGDLGKENGFYNMLGGLNEEDVLKYFYGNNWRTMFNNNQEGV